MVIGIDLDGVVFDSEDYYRTYANLYDSYIVKNGIFDTTEMNVFARHNWTKENADDFYEKYTQLVLESAPIKPGAKFVLDELKKQGHTLICITLRGFYRQCEIDITEKRLKDANIVFDKIVYSKENKLDACKKYKIELMIEDNHSTIEKLCKNNIKCLHMAGSGLKNVENENCTTVQNWAQVLDYILKN